ncbi:hypothetical protein OCGS_0817 [Oceaniovalibus guishaninsula JLT2003]|uniref:PIN domain-containing protein n=2 Tax=Oceaniovalibus TaxID=1207070 RepID=K2HF72_9RHOB|nr:hypothetical protein OCGS_0817 [Oceaniovalibus guishaninsula JLT2003]
MYRPAWSARILEEWARATVRLGPGAEPVARAEIALLQAAWPGASFMADQDVMDRLSLPDPNDVHVLATAVAASADVIVTFNAHDFPRATLAAEGIERLSPDQFLLAFQRVVPNAVQEVVGRVHGKAERLSGEALPLRGLLKRTKLPKLAKALAA